MTLVQKVLPTPFCQVSVHSNPQVRIASSFVFSMFHRAPQVDRSAQHYQGSCSALFTVKGLHFLMRVYSKTHMQREQLGAGSSNGHRMKKHRGPCPRPPCLCLQDPSMLPSRVHSPLSKREDDILKTLTVLESREVCKDE